MNEEIDDSEFYHQDFTTASEWEVFMARMEEIINQWKVDESKGEDIPDTGNIWNIKSEKIQFADTEFSIFLYSKHIECADTSESDDENEKHKSPIDTLYDFELQNENNNEDHSCISAWYGINEYIVLTPTTNSGITSESKIKILLSSAYIVSSNLISSGNISCPRPIFVQIRDKWQKCYLGVFESEIMRTNFEMIHLKKGPPHCNYLTGLLDLFKTKIMSSCNIENILVSVQQSYKLSDFGTHVWKQELLSDTNGLDCLFVLPFGVSVEPINSVVLKTTWNHLPNHLVVDSENYSDFDPKAAMKWSLLVKPTAEPVCLLADALTEFSQNLGNQYTVYDILGDFASLPSVDSNPLDLLTEPAVPTISRLLNRAARQPLTKNKKANNPPLSESTLVPLLYFLFPDADESTTAPYGREEKELEDSASPASPKRFEADFKGFKTCNNDSLPWRLSIVLAHCLQSLGGIRAFAHIWYEFVQEMRYRWEKSLPIPGLPPGLPDLRTCLLSQKLQMLNCCIDRRTCRETTLQSNYDSAEGSSTDDEFFDCSEKPAEEKAKEKYSLWNQPIGRKTKFGNLKLLKTGDPLYIPVTQEQVIKTEDQLQEDADFLLKLGSDAEATDLRARIMSSSLLSDMESFKAANPGAVVEDFIRWYSPRDWIENDNELDEWGQKAGQLSPRMLIEENNIWVETWETAKPVPAHRQRRLFDDTGEAEKVLQYLDMRTVSQICELIVPVLTHAAIYRILEEYQTVMADHQEFSTSLSNLLRISERLSRESTLQPRRFEAFIHELTSIELLISQVNSLQYKLNPTKDINEDINDLVIKLVTGKEVEIKNKNQSEIGKSIISMFGESQKSVLNEQSGDERNIGSVVFPPPSIREFVMRVNAVKPAVYSAKCPQFLRAVLSKDEFRLVGAFSEDTAFF